MTPTHSRRAFLKRAGALAVASVLPPVPATALLPAASYAGPWAEFSWEGHQWSEGELAAIREAGLPEPLVINRLG